MIQITLPLRQLFKSLVLNEGIAGGVGREAMYIQEDGVEMFKMCYFPEYFFHSDLILSLYNSNTY